MIAPIRPPLVEPSRPPERETPLQRARRAVAESLLNVKRTQPESSNFGERWPLYGLILALASAIAACYFWLWN